ncbi:MAG: ABC transporter permease [Thermomicrobiales bacterium]|nr:ABC transporter permease [Thermomicrobiales bacterium]
MFGSTVILILAIAALGAPLWAPHSPYTVDLQSYRSAPSATHWLGTDSSGRDVFSRLLYAGRVSMTVGLVAVSLYILIGVLLGAIAGYFGGKIDSLIMRATDVVLAFPTLILIITIVSIVGPSIYNVMAVIGFLGWPPIARLVRGNFLSLRDQEFVLAARTVGTPTHRMIFRHMLPNTLAPVIVAASLGMGEAILLEAGLSFLGLGVQPPTPSWGNMLTDAQSFAVLRTMPWLWIPPGLLIALTVLAVNFIGDGLRDAMDPRHTR